MTLGECIINYINEHDLSMRKFATLSGVSHAYISNIVNEKTSRGNAPVPSIDVYRGVAKAMGIDVETLISMVDDKIAWGEQTKKPITALGDGQEENGENLINSELLKRLTMLSPEELTKVDAFVQGLLASH